MKSHVRMLLLVAFAGLLFPTHAAGVETIPLQGAWNFQLDPKNAGVGERWFSKPPEDTIRLPGTTDEGHKGNETGERRTDRLSRVWSWKGPAWYQRQVTVPDDWAGKRVTLFLERSKNTRVWVDGTFCGWEDTLSAPQIFDVSKVMKPGRHTITVLVDNARLPPVGPSHAVDERTQTNWNGIVGRIELQASDPVWLEDVQVYANAAKKEALVRARVGNIIGSPAVGKLTVRCESYNFGKPVTFKPMTVAVDVGESGNLVEFTYQPGDDVPLWDEFAPAMLRLGLKLDAGAGGESFTDERSVCFGMRDFIADGSRLKINGRNVFLRGKLDCCFYPLTGYPPMDKDGWRRVFSIARSYGINHYRFHSWCPPEAAFEAADELGVYIQAELPNKRSAFNAAESGDAANNNIDYLDMEDTGKNVSLYDYGKRESELIFRRFGNHPSFVMYTLGNELGRNQGMFELIDHFKQLDPRRLYAQASNQMHWDPSLAAGDDFWVATALKDDHGDPLPLRGAYWVGDWLKGHIDHAPPSTMVDYSKSIADVPIPVVVHEIGSFEVSPDFSEIPKFTGVTRAGNLEIFRDRLREAGMLDQSPDFVRASGALSVICHREDIEAELRTPGLGGFQLLDIQDFPGQGTALVGILNVFMESKGLITPEAWREFCCETVPLLRMEKYTWTSDETFIGPVQVAHYGARDLSGARVTWTVMDDRGNKVAGGAFGPTAIAQGGVSEINTITFSLEDVAAPRKLMVTLAIEETPYRNHYPIWVYPPQADTSVPEGVRVADAFSDRKTRDHLATGGTVLLLPELGKLPRSVPGSFQTGFWSPMFTEAAEKRGIEPPAGTMGILCDPDAAALRDFPTEFHSNWQWWHLVKNSRPIVLDETPADYRPTVQVIDNFVRNHKLGLIFETKVGQGRLLVCAIDLPGHQDKPEARQMLHSLLNYVASPDFAPKAELDEKLLEKLLP